MKFTLKLIGRVIIDNPGKLLALIIATLSFMAAIHLPKSTYVEYCVTSFKDSGKYNYVIKTNSQQLNIKTFDSYIKPDGNNNITYSEIGGFEIFLYVLSVIMIICIIVAMVVDDDSGWDLSSNYRDALVAEIVVEQDGLFFNYVLNNKLIARVEEKNKHDVDYGLRSYVEAYRRNRNLFIEYKGTKQAIRDNKIKHIQDES